MGVGRSGQRPRRGTSHQHLPKVGSRADREYELREKRKVYLGGRPIALAALLVLVLAVAVIAIT